MQIRPATNEKSATKTRLQGAVLKAPRHQSFDRRSKAAYSYIKNSFSSGDDRQTGICRTTYEDTSGDTVKDTNREQGGLSVGSETIVNAHTNGDTDRSNDL
jgi:hypothetical protein